MAPHKPSSQDEMHGGEKEKFIPADTAKLNEGKRSFIETKLAQYEARVEKIEGYIGYRAPELLSEFYPYYDALAKMAAAQLLLGGGSVSKQDVEAFVKNSAREHWDDTFHDNPESLEHVLRDHEPVIQEAVKQGWSVLMAYNQGRMDAVRGSEEV